MSIITSSQHEFSLIIILRRWTLGKGHNSVESVICLYHIQFHQSLWNRMISIQVTLTLPWDLCKMVNTNVPMICTSYVPYPRSIPLRYALNLSFGWPRIWKKNKHFFYARDVYKMFYFYVKNIFRLNNAKKKNALALKKYPLDIHVTLSQKMFFVLKVKEFNTIKCKAVMF